MIWLLALLWPAGAAAVDLEAQRVDPRIEWVELQRAGLFEEALGQVERFLGSARPAAGDSLGAHYLRGRLLATLGRHERATSALATSLAEDPELAPWTRYRLAEAQIAQGHPEVAAGLLATLLGANPATDLQERAARLLAETLGRGGDCRLLANLDSWRLGASGRRRLRLERADCDRTGDPDTSIRELTALLAEDTTDAVAVEAAERLTARAPDVEAAVALDMARAFFGQRNFAQAIDLFSRALEPGALPSALRTEYETQYAVARSYFWLADYREAAARFEALTGLTSEPDEQARALYQQGRALELGGDRAAADGAFGRCHGAEPDGSWAAAALTSRARLAWLDGRETDALAHYQRLGDRRRWQGARARLALFLAASDIVRDRADRARAWLDVAAATPETHPPEVAYWQGRLAEAQGDPARAVNRYQRAIVEDPNDAWSLEARSRLVGDALAAETERAVAAFAASSRERDLLAAWLLAPQSEAGTASLLELRKRLSARRPERTFMQLASVPTAGWPLWQSPRNTPEELLMALGDWQLGFPAAARHFPVADERLGLSRSRMLAEAGRTRASILTAELVAKRAPVTLPSSLWSEELTRSLYPLAFATTIRREAATAGLDPLLMAALIREESRFDAAATSAAAARGLTQFVLPTARRLGQTLGLGSLRADDLLRPEIAIRLGATYLAELAERFGGRETHMLAAYNAGEAQADLWRSYCFSDDDAEFLTKVGFRETRGYLRKVLRSYARYRELYSSLGGESAVATTPGSGPSLSSK